MGSLTQAQIYGASPDDGKSQAVLSDGSGLYLRIGRSAKSKDYAPRYWQSRLKYQGKWVWIGIGSAYDITPDEARLKNLTLRAERYARKLVTVRRGVIS
ncbi:Arm DNA-binding domain-containing protein [Tateyamaria sp.]|uniref:Arm DNA-binding domain-containing protein n=1 Tax=Tateyamaria sp. TaxID=1929288 RepID=UPI003B225F3E